MTDEEKKAKRREYLRWYAREWRKNNPQKEGEYRRRLWEKKLKQGENEGKEENDV